MNGIFHFIFDASGRAVEGEGQQALGSESEARVVFWPDPGRGLETLPAAEGPAPGLSRQSRPAGIHSRHLSGKAGRGAAPGLPHVQDPPAALGPGERRPQLTLCRVSVTSALPADLFIELSLLHFLIFMSTMSVVIPQVF